MKSPTPITETRPATNNRSSSTAASSSTVPPPSTPATPSSNARQLASSDGWPANPDRGSAASASPTATSSASTASTSTASTSRPSGEQIADVKIVASRMFIATAGWLNVIHPLPANWSTAIPPHRQPSRPSSPGDDFVGNHAPTTPFPSSSASTPTPGEVLSSEIHAHRRARLRSA